MLNTLPNLQFPSVCGKAAVANFEGGDISSDAGCLLLGLAERKWRIAAALSRSIRDRRKQGRVRHSLATMVIERVMAIAAGYEDCNDLDDLGADPILKSACGVLPSGPNLPAQPTLSRFENSVGAKDLMRAGLALAERTVAQLPTDSAKIILDIDVTDDPCHGQQEFEFFNGFYDTHCYLHLLVFATGSDDRQRLMGALLRHGKTHPTHGARWMLRHAVELIRARFPGAQIIVRGDCGFGCDKILRICDRLGVDYVLGLPRNRRLQVLSTPTQLRACIGYTCLKRAQPLPPAGYREFGEFDYRAGTWDRMRRTIAKAQITRGELNPRFVVTNLTQEARADQVYALYCARGDSENRIKEYKLDLASGRTSCHRFLANQFRLLLHTAAAVLMAALQDAAHGTQWANAQAGTLRLGLLKVGARVIESTRRILFELSSAFPHKQAWHSIYARLET